MAPLAVSYCYEHNIHSDPTKGPDYVISLLRTDSDSPCHSQELSKAE